MTMIKATGVFVFDMIFDFEKNEQIVFRHFNIMLIILE